MSIAFKGTLNNGDYVAMTAEEYVEHKTKEYNTMLMRKLEKLANNPALSEEVKQLLWQARCKCYCSEMWRDSYLKFREQKVNTVSNQEKKDIIPFGVGVSKSWGECPSCGRVLFIYGKNVEMNYCHFCGQALNWKRMEDYEK